MIEEVLQWEKQVLKEKELYETLHYLKKERENKCTYDMCWLYQVGKRWVIYQILFFK